MGVSASKKPAAQGGGEPRFTVRPMTPADREGRARVHYIAWKETYAGLMDGRVLAAHTLERCRERAARGGPGDTLVALDREDGDRVAGFACFAPRARSFASVEDAGEIGALYVLREYQGLGIGKMLLERCLARLDCPKAVLFVLEGNEKAARFYEHMGFRFTGRRVALEKGGGRLAEAEMARGEGPT